MFRRSHLKHPWSSKEYRIFARWMLGKIFRICKETDFGMYHGCRNMSSPDADRRRLDLEDGGTLGRCRDMLTPWVKAAMYLRQFGVRNACVNLRCDKRRVP